MKELLYFYLENCPHCKRADKLLEEVISENPEFSDVTIKKIEEKRNLSIAESYNYYYVPCFFLDNKNIHEGSVKKQDIEFVLKEAIK